MSYLGSDLKFKTTYEDIINDALNFTFSIVPKDVPLNTDYGVEVPSSVTTKDFCSAYKSNLETALSKLPFNLKVSDVVIEGRLLKVTLIHDNNSEVWNLTI